MPKIVLEASDEQLASMVAELKKVEPQYKVLNARKLLQLLLQQEIDWVDVYLNTRIDGGGNSLIGDVLEEEDCKGIVEEEQS